MPKQIVLLSGSISSGKSTLSGLLNTQFGLHVLKTNRIIQNLAVQRLGAEIQSERRAMQKFGESLDKDTKGKWVRDALARLIHDLGPAGTDALVVVDAVRILDQIRAIRQAYSFSVVHVHLKAPDDVLEARYKDRRSTGFKELGSFSEAEKNRTEARVKDLEDAADFVIDTSRSLAQAVLVRAATHQHGVLVGEKTVVGIQSKLVARLHSTSQDRTAQFSRSGCGDRSVEEDPHVAAVS
ncbi:MAG: AAA family ATPase [Candidatus Acidiferrum sp.]